jgi:hypothetical protein
LIEQSITRELGGCPYRKPKTADATANRLILAPDERFLQVDLVRPAGRTLAMPVLCGLHRQYFRA